MPVNVSAVLSVITGMFPGVVAVGLAVLGVRAATEAFRYVRDVLGVGGGPDPNDPNDPRNYDHDVFVADVAGPDPNDPNDPRNYDHDVFAPYPALPADAYNNYRVNAIHEENGWDPEWDEPAPAPPGFPLAPAVVQAYADSNGIPPRV